VGSEWVGGLGAPLGRRRLQADRRVPSMQVRSCWPPACVPVLWWWLGGWGGSGGGGTPLGRRRLQAGGRVPWGKYAGEQLLDLCMCACVVYVCVCGGGGVRCEWVGAVGDTSGAEEAAGRWAGAVGQICRCAAAGPLLCACVVVGRGGRVG
jgi:hypothetical protein